MTLYPTLDTMGVVSGIGHNGYYTHTHTTLGIIDMSDYGYWTETGEEVTEDELYDAYDNYLDAIDGDVNVAGMTFAASEVVKELDPIAYRVGLNDFYNFMIEDGEIIED